VNIEEIRKVLAVVIEQVDTVKERHERTERALEESRAECDRLARRNALLVCEIEHLIGKDGTP
jgi:hypothetical protein